MRRDDAGSASLLVIVLMPLLIAVTAGVLQLGALRVVAIRIASAADLAVLAAIDDQDETALVNGRAWSLAPDAETVARAYFGLNLAHIASSLAISPDDAAARADVAAFRAPATDPLTGWRYDTPAVRIAASVPVRTPAFAVLLLPSVTVVNVRSASSAR